MMLLSSNHNKGHNRTNPNSTTQNEMIIFGQIIIRTDHNSFKDPSNRIEGDRRILILIQMILKKEGLLTTRILILILIIVFKENHMKDRILIDKDRIMIMIGIDSPKIIINREIINMKEN